MNDPDNKAQYRELKKELRDYWKVWKDTPKDAVELLKGEYIDKLLVKIMQHVHYPEEHCTVLAMCVGLSWEPLIQTMYAYRPDFLLAIFNRNYRSLKKKGTLYKREPKSEMEKDFREIVKHLHSKGWTGKHLLDEGHTKCPDIQDDTPEEIFRALHNGLEKFYQLPGFPADAKIVVDITGSRKSMTSGAFLYAAYSGVTISYVDQDETRFDVEEGRMFDFEGRIGELGNPYELFRLREWETVRNLYHQNNFGAAQRVLGEIAKTMQAQVETGRLFSEEQVRNVHGLESILRCYEAWDSGNLQTAWEKAEEIKRERPGFTPPAAVAVLGQSWPSGNTPDELLNAYDKLQYGDPGRQEASIFLDRKRITLYAKDELLRVKRLIDPYEDYRSALLRAAGLSEFLIKARWAALWQAHKSTPPLLYNGISNKPVDTSNDDFYCKLFDGIVSHDGLRYLVKALEQAPDIRGLDVRIKGKGYQKVCLVIQNSGYNLALNAGGITPIKLSELRNGSIHFCLQINPCLAKDAYSLAENNLNEYLGKWVRLLDPEEPVEANGNIGQMEWPRLCELCGLDFLPRKLQQN